MTAPARLALVVVLTLAALIAFLPLRLVLGSAHGPLSARAVEGSAWNGRLRDARLGPAPLGDVRARLRPLALLRGIARVGLSSPSGAQRIEATVEASRAGFALDRTTGRIPLAGALAPLPLVAVALDKAQAHFAGGRCVRASGRVIAEVSGEFSGLRLPDRLTGSAQCVDGALLVPLVSDDGAEAVSVRLPGDGGWRADVRVRAPTSEMAERLEASGFVRRGDVYRLAIEGRF